MPAVSCPRPRPRPPRTPRRPCAARAPGVAGLESRRALRPEPEPDDPFHEPPTPTRATRRCDRPDDSQTPRRSTPESAPNDPSRFRPMPNIRTTNQRTPDLKRLPGSRRPRHLPGRDHQLLEHRHAVPRHVGPPRPCRSIVQSVHTPRKIIATHVRVTIPYQTSDCKGLSGKKSGSIPAGAPPGRPHPAPTASRSPTRRSTRCTSSSVASVRTAEASRPVRRTTSSNVRGSASASTITR